jgi:MFS family permease
LNNNHNEWRSGWRALAGGSIGTALSYGLFLMTAGLFIIPMQQEFGWSRSAVSIGPIVGLAAACMAPFGGVVIDRFGARPIAIAGLVALGLLYILLAVAPPSQLYLYAVVAMLAVVATITSAVIYCAGIVTWFRKNSGLAIGITMSGLSLTAAIAMPMLASLIERLDWRAGYLALSGVTLLIGLPFVVAWFREAPKPLAHATGAGLGQAVPPAEKDGMDLPTAVRDKRFWLCVACFGGAALPIGGFMSQLQPLLIGNGFSSEHAAAAGAVFALSIGFGRLVGGVLLDRLHAPTVAAVLLALPTLGALLLVNGSTETVWVIAALAVFLLGLGQGAEADFIAFFTLRIFGTRSYATIYSTIGASVGGGMALGGIAFAGLHDLTGSYDIAVYVSAALYSMAALIALTIKVPSLDARS